MFLDQCNGQQSDDDTVFITSLSPAQRLYHQAHVFITKEIALPSLQVVAVASGTRERGRICDKQQLQPCYLPTDAAAELMDWRLQKGSHSSSTCQATMEEVQFVSQGNDRGGFNNYSNWRPQQNNWTTQLSSYQRSAQPPGFQIQPFRVKEEDWIKVGNVLTSLDATVKDMQNQEQPSREERDAHRYIIQNIATFGLLVNQVAANFFRRNWERQAIVGASNLRGDPRDEITVRGQVVNISIEAIKEVLHLPEADFNYEDGAYKAMDDPPEDELPYVLCSRSAELKWSKRNGLLKYFPASDLKPEYRQWYNMICTT
ncbi:OLC1v1000895C1 [Oldenlandia corymbosa var. corymbosa]|uniref:OLC1v1000895C1 n=1 Tax=Oldenlandia corymbosa var. corymbosa TaxID=529605 RepID=A0AAV1D702_OLDCO|nr:OLC1v1000895C1 [Oldenlandia corymbosa var. corymbosa]